MTDPPETNPYSPPSQEDSPPGDAKPSGVRKAIRIGLKTFFWLLLIATSYVWLVQSLACLSLLKDHIREDRFMAEVILRTLASACTILGLCVRRLLGWLAFAGLVTTLAATWMTIVDVQRGGSFDFEPWLYGGGYLLMLLLLVTMFDRGKSAGKSSPRP